jgi:5'-methylthioadenosine phosphorylase
LAKEKEMCYCALAVATDYDSGLVAEGKVQPVSVEEIISGFQKNIDKAKKLILEMIRSWPGKVSCQCQKSLKQARF